MSYSTAYADTLSSYGNAQAIASQLQKKVDQIDGTDMLFGAVDYSNSYGSIFDGLDESIGSTDGSNGTGGSNGTDGSNGAGASNGTGGNSGALAEDGGTKATSDQVAALREEFKQIQDEQGWVGKAWNGIKNFFGSKNGSNAIEETLNKVESGEISIEAAEEKLNNYRTKQKSTVNTFANVASGLAVAIGVIGAPFSFGASLAIGAAVGAAVKVGIKASDAATNNVKGDYDVKDVAKDGITGAIGGVVTAATAGVGTAATVVSKETGKVLLGQTIKAGAIAGAKAGAIDGAVMGAANYSVDCAFEEDQNFTLGGLVSNTVSGAATGAVAGGVAGGASAGVRGARLNSNMTKLSELEAKQANGTLTEAETAQLDALQGKVGSANTTEVSQYGYKKLASEKSNLARLNEGIDNGKITSIDDAKALGFSDDMINKTSLAPTNQTAAQASAEITPPGASGAQSAAGDAAEEAADEAKKSLLSGIRERFGSSKAGQRLQNLAGKASNLKGMTRQQVWDAVTGKTNATYSEFKNAYNDLYAKGGSADFTDKANVALRTFLEDIWLVGNPNNI